MNRRRRQSLIRGARPAMLSPATASNQECPMTKLDKPLRREIAIGDQAYTLTIDPDGLKLVPKGHRNGVSVSWRLRPASRFASPVADIP
jgi:hypothetical protein